MSESTNPKWYKEFFEEMGIEYEDYPFTKNTEYEVDWMINMDMDEFIVCDKSIPVVLQKISEKYDVVSFTRNYRYISRYKILDKLIIENDHCLHTWVGKYSVKYIFRCNSKKIKELGVHCIILHDDDLKITTSQMWYRHYNLYNTDDIKTLNKIYDFEKDLIILRNKSKIMSYNRKEIEPYNHIEHFKRNTALLVSMDKNGKLNVMALDWKKIEELDGDPVIRIQVDYSRYTYKLLTEGINEFTVNIPLENNYKVIDIAGSYSGRNIDKFKEGNFEIIPGKRTKVPTIKDCILSYECQIVHSSKSDISSHHYFYGKILVAYASTELIK